MSLQSPERILLVRLSSIGDIILTTPLIRCLREKFPASRIDFLTKAKYAELIRHHPGLSTVLEFPDNGDLRALQAQRGSIRRHQYDLILDLHKNLRSIFLTLGLRRSTIRRIKKYGVRRFFLVKMGLNFYRKIQPVYRRYLDVAADFGVQDDRRGTTLYFPTHIASAIDDMLAARVSSPENLICLAPGAGKATKRWPLPSFIAVARSLAERGYHCCILGDDRDRLLGRELMQAVPDCIDLTGRLSLLESAAVLRRARLLITNDSGLMHMAEAAGTPVVAIFGSTVRELGFFPYRRQSRVVENPTIRCRPCSHIGRDRCPRRHFRCMTTLQPARVLAEAAALL